MGVGWKLGVFLFFLSGLLREVPAVGDRLGNFADYMVALLGNRVGVGILMAHHDEGLAISRQS